MTKTKTAEEKIAELDEQMERIRARKKAILSRQKEEERKVRTKRLITIGAEVEYYAGCQITNMDSFKDFLRIYKKAIAETQNPKIQELISEIDSKSIPETESDSIGTLNRFFEINAR